MHFREHEGQQLLDTPLDGVQAAMLADDLIAKFSKDTILAVRPKSIVLWRGGSSRILDSIQPDTQEIRGPIGTQHAANSFARDTLI